jgi:hypothetical protein
MNMQGFKDLIASERGIFCIAALVFATALVVVGKLTGELWLDFVKWLVGALVASKTVTTAVETVTMRKPQNPPATEASPLPEARTVE